MGESLWSLDDDASEATGEDCKCLFVNLVKPPLTESEMLWKKHKRMDNLNAERGGDKMKKGYRFFVDDEDAFQLEGLLQALCFLEVGSAFVPGKPWERQSGGARRVSDVALLPEDAKEVLASLLDAKEAEANQ